MKSDKKVFVALAIPESTRAKLRKLAAFAELTMSEIFQRLIEEKYCEINSVGLEQLEKEYKKSS